MKYKMIVTDCDDTLLNSSLMITEFTKKAVTKYVENGGKFVIATGRMTPAVLPFCYELGLKGEVITYQGAVTADIQTGEIIDITQMGFQDAYEIALHIEKLGYYFHMYYNDTFYVKTKTKYSEDYSKLSQEGYEELNCEISEFIKQNKITPPKMMIITEDDKVMPLIEQLKKEYGTKFLFNTSKKWMLEIVPIVVNKGVAVSKLAEKYNIKQQEVICIGDSLNDLAMIEYAGLGVVVDNGTREAKKAADIIAPSNDEDGVAYIINKYGFLE